MNSVEEVKALYQLLREWGAKEGDAKDTALSLVYDRETTLTWIPPDVPEQLQGAACKASQ